MSLTITGPQFVKNGDTNTYTVAGLLAGYALYSIDFPDAWEGDSIGIITAGEQIINLITGIGSGTIIITYIDSSDTLKTIYYDVFCSSTKRGEEIQQNGAILIPTTDIIHTPDVCGNIRCPFTLEVFADTDNPTLDSNNDKSDFYFNGNSAIASIGIVLEKLVNGIWTNSITFTNSTYGQFFAFGKHPDFSGNDFIDDFGKKYTGLFLNWLTVRQNKGLGTYRIKIIYTDIFSAVTTLYYQSEFNLRAYSCNSIDGTVRIQSFNQGLRGILDNNTLQIDYSTGWHSQIRLRGLFLYRGSAYNKEYNQYGDR